MDNLDLLSEQQAELYCGGLQLWRSGRGQSQMPSMGRARNSYDSAADLAGVLSRFMALTSINIVINQFNIAFNFVLAGGSVMNHQVNALAVHLSA